MYNDNEIFPLCPPLQLPSGVSEQQLFDFVTSVRVHDGPEEEMRAYCTHDFRRFVYTLGMAKDLTGKCLELGGNPYFTTMLLKQFTKLDLYVANFFGDKYHGNNLQSVDYNELYGTKRLSTSFSFEIFNVEEDTFPYNDSTFELIIFAEIIEHLLMDPCKALLEIRRVLKPGGTLILTTPNVARLENIAKIISGSNIYDPYSGYGPYGRHNREYNIHELNNLLSFVGFKTVSCFTADVHSNLTENYYDLKDIKDFLNFRKEDLGQYIFIKAELQNSSIDKRKPNWLYRSYPQNELI